MKLSILTTITNPDDRQDMWRAAFDCYTDLADEVVVVNGGKDEIEETIKGIFVGHGIKVFHLPWPYEWNWVELPRHLNAGLRGCTGDWVLKLDIDQFIHEKDFKELRAKLEVCPPDIKVATFQKMSMTYGKKYYQKGGQEIAFRREPGICFGKNLDKKTDLCFPIKMVNTVEALGSGYALPVGQSLGVYFKTGISYWNYDYFFKTQKFTMQEFWRFAKAYHRYFGDYKFGKTWREAFHIFQDMMRGRYKKSPYTYKLSDHPKYIREAVENLTKEQFGHSGWGLL